MASGDRKIKIKEVTIGNGNPVPWEAPWQAFVEDNTGKDQYIAGGLTVGDFGPPASFNVMTGAQIKASVKTAVQNDPAVPPNNGVS